MPSTTTGARYLKAYRLDQLRGVSRTPVPSGPVIAHVEALVAAGMTRKAIAEAAGVGNSTLYHLTAGEHPTCQRRVANAVLRVRPATTRRGPAARVPAVGSRRRIRALLRMGWPHDQIHARSGIRTAVTLNQQGPWVTAATHAALAAVYDDLAMIPGPSPWTRGRATRAGYPPPLAWDDDTIDDPSARPFGVDGATRGPRRGRGDVDPAVVHRRARGDHAVPLTTAERLAVVAELTGHGLSQRALASRAGLHERQVVRDLATLARRRATTDQGATGDVPGEAEQDEQVAS